jgi:hypothetical protein
VRALTTPIAGVLPLSVNQTLPSGPAATNLGVLPAYRLPAQACTLALHGLPPLYSWLV